jgi:hypothetical protein
MAKQKEKKIAVRDTIIKRGRREGWVPILS